MRILFTQLQAGAPDRTLMSDGLSAYFTDQLVADFSTSLGPLGKPESIVQMRADRRGGLTQRIFRVRLAGQATRVSTFFAPDGKSEQCIVYP